MLPCIGTDAVTHCAGLLSVHEQSLACGQYVVTFAAFSEGRLLCCASGAEMLPAEDVATRGKCQ